MFEPDLELREKVFRKMGYERKDDGHKVFWRTDERLFLEPLPLIETSWEVCAKYLVPFMRDKGWGFYVSCDNESENYFNWGRNDKPPFAVGADIVEYNSALAACKAYLEVEL